MVLLLGVGIHVLFYITLHAHTRLELFLVLKQGSKTFQNYFSDKSCSVSQALGRSGVRSARAHTGNTYDERATKYKHEDP